MMQLCTSMLWWQAAEEGNNKILKFGTKLRTVSHTLPNCPTNEHVIIQNIKFVFYLLSVTV